MLKESILSPPNVTYSDFTSNIKCGQTNQPTDRPTDQQTNEQNQQYNICKPNNQDVDGGSVIKMSSLFLSYLLCLSQNVNHLSVELLPPPTVYF